MNAVIALCKCSKTKKLYGIRFERTGKDWTFTWAFPIQEKVALNEQYDKTRIVGNLIKGEEFPGCPHCGSIGFFHCGCGKLNCWDGNSLHATCSWCGSSGELSDGIESIDITSNI